MSELVIACWHDHFEGNGFAGVPRVPFFVGLVCVTHGEAKGERSRKEVSLYVALIQHGQRLALLPFFGIILIFLKKCLGFSRTLVILKMYVLHV